MQRPPPWLWLKYAAGGRLSDRYIDWVFHDLNDRGWRMREVLRVLGLAMIPVIGAMFLPGSLALRLMTAVLILAGPLFVAAAYGDEMRAYRLRQHGLLPPSGPDPV